MFVSLDGNMGLVRKKGPAMVKLSPKHGERFFIQAEVDETAKVVDKQVVSMQ